MAADRSNVQKLIAAAIAGFDEYACESSAEDIANACMNLAARGALAVLDLSAPGAVEHNRAALLEGADAIRRHIEQWPITDDDRGIWN